MHDLNELIKNTNQNIPEKWNQARRLEFIDFRLGNEGKFNRKDLVEFFNISTPQASLDIAKYQSLVASLQPKRENLVYDRHKKVYLRTDDYAPVFLFFCSPDYYLNDLLALANGKLPESRNFFGYVPNVAAGTFVPPARNVKPNILYYILDAIKNQRAIHINYISMSSMKNKDYLLAPHALAYDGFRWHVRAYSYDHHEFRDFVLSRIVKASVPEIPAPRDRYPAKDGNGFIEAATTCYDDKQWFELVDLILKANPELPPAQRRAIEYDYGMENGQVIYTCKRALLFYAIRWLRLTKEDKALPNNMRQVVLDNEDEVFRRLNGGN